MKKKNVNLFFNYSIDEYKVGWAYKLNITEAEEKALLRRGCIYASKDAKYYQEQKPTKPTEKKPVEPAKAVDPIKVAPLEVKPIGNDKGEVKDVDSKKDIQQAKVQKGSIVSNKSNK